MKKGSQFGIFFGQPFKVVTFLQIPLRNGQVQRKEKNNMALSKEQSSAIIKNFEKNEKDTGSAEVQIALLTQRIKDLTLHLKSNPQDAGARRSLLILVGKRHSLLDYLRNTDTDRYAALIEKLGLRK